MEFHRCDFEGMPVQVHEFMELVRGLSPDGEGRRWQEQANCLGVDPDLFFPERGASTREAKGVCRGCEVRTECLEYALDHGEKFGIWGGLSERERRRVRRQRALERRRLASA
jgi:WhiB family transcriptional regulator, redox-sensing transcriptional regulator